MNQKNNTYGTFMTSFNVVYPILIYFVVMTLAMNIFAVIVVKLGGDIQKQYMLLQTLVSAVTLPFIYRYYRKDKIQPTVFHQHLEEVLQQKSRQQRIVNGVLMLFAGAAIGIAVNNVMALTELEKISEGYQQVTKNFFAGEVIFEILGACLVTPVLEEMLYRSVVYGRISDLMILKLKPETPEGQKRQKKNRIYAIVFTSLIFGAMHMNLVQLIYALVLGLMLAWFVEESGHLYGAVAGHIGANLMSVLRMETGLFQWMMINKSIFLISTVVFLAAGAVLLAVIWKYNAKTETV